MFLLDTNICIYLIKKTYPHLSERLLSSNPDDFAVSSITVCELEYGASKSRWGDRTRDQLKMFLVPFHILPFDTKDALIAGKIRAHLTDRGKPVGPYDLQIAAQALARGLPLITHNTKEFSRIPDLKIEDWCL